VVRARPRRPGLAIGGRRDSWPQGPKTSRTQHSCGLRRPGPAGPGGCAGNKPRPVPIRVRSRLRGHSRSGRLTSAAGGSSSARLTGGAGRPAIASFFRGRGPAGVGRTWDGAWAPSPYSVRRRHADLVSSPDPPPDRGPRVDHRGPAQVGRGRRPIKASGYRGCGRGHPAGLVAK
jgi:hypothetical protein